MTLEYSRNDLVRHSGERSASSAAKYCDHLGRAGRLVLDVGCGDGTVVRELSRRGVTAAGVDCFVGPWTDLTTVLIADGFALPFPDGRFDAAGSFTVLEHLAEPARLLAEMARVTRPGGRIVIGCPNMRAVFLSHPGHFRTHRGGIAQRISNLAVYLMTCVRSIFSGGGITFEIFPPPDMMKIPEGASDYNALCATNFATLKHELRRLGFRIEYISSGMEYDAGRTRRIARAAIDRIPILRELFGGIFVVAIKKVR